jgi:hypothetical protein
MELRFGFPRVVYRYGNRNRDTRMQGGPRPTLRGQHRAALIVRFERIRQIQPSPAPLPGALNFRQPRTCPLTQPAVQRDGEDYVRRALGGAEANGAGVVVVVSEMMRELNAPIAAGL